LFAGLTTPSLAAEKYFVTVDTVGNCSIVLDMPGTDLSAGKTAIGNAEGYGSIEDAKKFLDQVRDDTSKCKAVVVG
jgi:hypothetical protein